MTGRAGIAILLVAVFCARSMVGQETNSSSATRRQPNVVLLFADDQGYGDVGCFGAKAFKTPKLDRLESKERGLRVFMWPRRFALRRGRR